MAGSATALGGGDAIRATRTLQVALASLLALVGLSAFVAPRAVAVVFSLPQTDPLAARLAGAALVGFAGALLVGIGSTWRSLRIPSLAVAVFGGALVLAGILAGSIDHGGSFAMVTAVTFLALASVVFAPVASRVLQAPAPLATPTDLGPWFQGLLRFSTVAALVLGILWLATGDALVSLLGRGAGSGPLYRVAGAAMVGQAVASLLALRAGRWVEVALAAVMASITNLLWLVATLAQVRAVGPGALTFVLLAVFTITAAGASIAVLRRGR